MLRNRLLLGTLIVCLLQMASNRKIGIQIILQTARLSLIFPPMEQMDGKGIGDYQTVGDSYKEGGGQPFVVTLHITRNTPQGVITQHYSSITDSTIRGDAPLKFTEACDLLVTSPLVRPLMSTGMTMYRNWHAAGFFPALGPPKQASIQHHIELLSSLV